MGKLLVALALFAHLALDLRPAPPVAAAGGDHGRGEPAGAGPFADRTGGDTEAFGYLTGGNERVVVGHLDDAKGAIRGIGPADSNGVKNSIGLISAIGAIDSIRSPGRPGTGRRLRGDRAMTRQPAMPDHQPDRGGDGPHAHDGEQRAVSTPSMGSRVAIKGHDGRPGQTGVVVGPDQHFYPNPHSLFVHFDSGQALLIAVTDLTATPDLDAPRE